jgi:hypothetical protein
MARAAILRRVRGEAAIVGGDDFGFEAGANGRRQRVERQRGYPLAAGRHGGLRPPDRRTLPICIDHRRIRTDLP